MARLLSLNVGLPQDVPWRGRTVHTGIFKRPVEGPRHVRTLNVDGDGQGDLGGHGGEMRAVLVYQRESYDFWRQRLGRDDLEYGQFGENLTVDGLADDEVHIGDRYRIGDVELEVTQPRVTCFRVGMRLGEPTMPALLVSERRPGFYCRVITEGQLEAGDDIIRTHIGRHRMTVAAIDALLYLPERDIDQLRLAVDLPALSPGWQASFRELLDGAEGRASGAPPAVGVEPNGWTGFRPLRVARIAPETGTVASIYLTAPDGRPLPLPQPGQHIALRLTDAGDPAPVRNYSLSATPSDREYRISVKREPHGIVSTYLHTRLRVGDTVEVAAPRGDFVLSPDQPDEAAVLLLSAGVGVTPVLAMLHALVTARSGREVWWLYSARSAAEHAFAAEAHGLLSSLERGHERVYYTGADPTVGLDPPAVRGRLDRDALAALDLPAAATAYVCGPRAFMDDMRAALLDLGIDPRRVHTELFGALASINPGLTDITHAPPHQPSGPAGDGPRITFARSGLTVPWSDDHATLLDLAEACDVPTRWSCRTGVCHTCETAIFAGTVRYRTDPLEPPPPGTVLVCCAEPETDLVLDL